mgnify:CR=1 FL=1
MEHGIILSKIIRLQSYLRMYIVRKQNPICSKNRIVSKSEQAFVQLQAIVRGWLVRRRNENTSLATIKIQTYWRMWYDRVRFKRCLLHYHNEQIQLSYFFKQIDKVI